MKNSLHKQPNCEEGSSKAKVKNDYCVVYFLLGVLQDNCRAGKFLQLWDWVALFLITWVSIKTTATSSPVWATTVKTSDQMRTPVVSLWLPPHQWNPLSSSPAVFSSQSSEPSAFRYLSRKFSRNDFPFLNAPSDKKYLRLWRIMTRHDFWHEMIYDMILH